MRSTSRPPLALIWLVLASLICLAPLPVEAALSVKAEIHPDPVQPGETIEAQITVSSTSTSGNLVLRLLWPGAMNSQNPQTTGSGSCPGTCDPGDLLTWTLGSLGSGSSFLVGFAGQVPSGATNGTILPFQFELLEGGVSRTIFTNSIEVQADSPLELTLDPLTDPVPPSGSFAYELVYGNAGSALAVDCELRIALPAGTHFVSASGNGQLVGGAVVWDLGDLGPGSGGREQVTVGVGALAASTLLAAEDVRLTGAVNSLPKIARAKAVSRVGAQALQLQMEADPDPLTSNELIDTQIVVSNPTAQPTDSLTLRLWWPDELDAENPVTTGGSCPGTCDAGDTLVYSLGVLPPFSTRVLGMNEPANNLASGRLVPLEVELVQGNLAVRNLSHTLIHKADSPLELRLDPLADPVAPGGRLVYELTYGNAGAAAAQQATLAFPLPAGSRFFASSPGGSLDGDRVIFALGDLAPNASGRRTVEVLVPSAANGTLVPAAAEFAAQVSFLPQAAHAMAVSRIQSPGTLTAAAEIQADPVAPNELIDAQIAILNAGASATGSLTLRLLWPQELDAENPVAPGGACPGTCDQGDYLTFNLGVLGPGASQIVSVNESANSWPNGTVVPFEIELLDGATPISTISKTLILDASSPLELALDVRTDPVAPGALLVYDVTYGNNGAAAASAALLTFPLPAGTTFVAATGEGRFANGVVSWPIGSLPANSGGRVQATVRVPASPANRLLDVRDATLSATVNGLPESTRAAALSRVAAVSRSLSLALAPNPIDAGQLVNGQFTITNSSGSPTGALTLRLLWPDELNAENPTTTGGGACPGTCDEGDYLSWSLGVLGPGASATVGFSENLPSLVRGTLVPWEAELIEGGLPARTVSQTLLVGAATPDTDGDGETNALDPDDDNDSMPDTWELRYGLNPFSAGDANLDPDGDGLSNRDEFRLGSHPFVRDYVFADGFENGTIQRWH